MAKFIELVANTNSEQKLIFNTDHIMVVMPKVFEGVTQIMLPGVTFEVKEPYEEVKQMLNPH